MSQYPVFVALYADREPGSNEWFRKAQALLARCNELGIFCEVHDVLKEVEWYEEEHGPWPNWRVPIWRYIPEFCIEMLVRHNRPILFMAADTIMLKRPPDKLFRGDVMYQGGLSDGWTALASPVFYNNTPGAHKFLEDFKNLCVRDKSPNSEHESLEALIVGKYAGNPGVSQFPVTMSTRHGTYESYMVF